jgi:hypothetical protein
MEQFATPQLAIGDRAGTAAQHGQPERNGDQGYQTRIEVVASPPGRDRPEAAEK